jgi:hypothetical protein
MKINPLILQIFITIAVFIFTSCVPATTLATQPIETASSTITPSPSSTPHPKSTLVFPASLTPIPNMHPEKVPQLIEALQNKDCKLPCYLGLIPGKTKLQEGITILENLGGIRFISGWGPNPYQRETDGALSYTYEFGIGDPLPEGRIIYHSVTLVTDNDLVQVIEVRASPNINESLEPAASTYQTYWKRYSLREIFLQMGEPESIYSDPRERPVESGTQWILVYDRQSIQIDLYDSWLENKLCPSDEVKVLHMTLSYSDSSFSIYADGRVPPTDREIYLPIEEMFGVTVHQFYKQVLEDSLVCFEPKTPNP